MPRSRLVSLQTSSLSPTPDKSLSHTVIFFLILSPFTTTRPLPSIRDPRYNDALVQACVRREILLITQFELHTCHRAFTTSRFSSMRAPRYERRLSSGIRQYREISLVHISFGTPSTSMHLYEDETRHLPSPGLP